MLQPSHFKSRCPFLANPHFAHLATILSANVQNTTENIYQRTRISYQTIEISDSKVADTQVLSSSNDRHASPKQRQITAWPRKAGRRGLSGGCLVKVTLPPLVQQAFFAMPTARCIGSNTPYGPAAGKPDVSQSCVLFCQPHNWSLAVSSKWTVVLYLKPPELALAPTDVTRTPRPKV